MPLIPRSTPSPRFGQPSKRSRFRAASGRGGGAKARWGALLAAAAFCFAGVARAQTFLEPLWTAGVDSTTGQPLIAELFADGRLHVVATDRKGRVVAFDGASGKSLWSNSVGSNLTDPVSCNAAPNGSTDIAAASRDDRKLLYLFDGASGSVIGSYQLSAPARHAPTPFPLGASPDGAPRHGLAIADDQGAIHLLAAVEAEDGSIAFQKLRDVPTARDLEVHGPVVGPASVGSVLGAESVDIVFTFEDGIVVVNRDDPSLPLVFKKTDFYNDGGDSASGRTPHPQRAVLATDEAQIRTMAVAGNVKQNARADGQDFAEIVFGLRVSGSAFYGALDYSAGRAGSGLLNQWRNEVEKQAIGTFPYDPLLVNFSGALHPEVIMCGPKDAAAFGGTGQIRHFSEATAQQFVAAPIAIYGQGNSSAILFFQEGPDGTGSLRARLTSNLAAPAQQHPLDFRPDVQPVAGDLDGEPSKHEIVFMTNKKRLACFRLAQLDVTPARSISWQCRGGTIYRAGGHRPGYEDEIISRRGQLRALVSTQTKAAEQAWEKGDLAAARKAAEIVLSVNPNIREASDIRAKVHFRENFVLIVAKWIALAAIAGATLFFGWKFGGRAAQMKKATDLAAAAKPGEALEICHKLRVRFPKDAKICDLLAQCALAAADWAPRNVAPFRERLSREQSNGEVLQGLVRCLLSTRDTSPENFALYKRAEELMPESATLKYVMGRMLKTDGEMRLAQDRFRQAIKLLNPPEEAYGELADILLVQDGARAKNLEVFEEAVARDPGNAHVLRGLCLAMIDAKRFDQRSRDVCERALGVDPGFVPAIVHLCQAHIQEGEMEEAVAYAKQALGLDSNNEEAIRLMAECCLIQGRDDDEAARALENASRRFPGDRETTCALARIYIKRGRLDDEARKTCRQAFELNPNDPKIAEAVVKFASESKETALAIKAGERLLDLGVGTPSLYRMLADAYVATHAVEERVERVFREAMRADPQNRGYISHLAKVYCVLSRVDAEAQKSYEAAYQLNPTFEVGKQLAKSYHHNDQLEDVARLVPKLLLLKPDDSELQKLLAQASFSGNRLEEAIEQYEAVLARDRDDPDALAHLAAAYARKGLTDDRSLSLYKRALELEPKSDMLWMMVGRSAIARGDSAGSAAAYKRAVLSGDAAPDRVIRELKSVLAKGVDAMELRWLLAEALLHRNRLRETCEELNAIFEADPSQMPRVAEACGAILLKDPENQAAMLQRGTLLKAMGRFDEARVDLRTAFELNPTNVDTQRELAELYERVLRESDDAGTFQELGEVCVAMGDYDRAIGCFQRSAQDFRHENFATKMLGRCFMEKNLLDLALEQFAKLPVDEEAKDLLYELGGQYERKKDVAGAKTAYKRIYSADINYHDVRQRMEALASGSTIGGTSFAPSGSAGPGAPVVGDYERTMIHQDLSLEAQKRYELLQELGRGAMGIVYKARDNELDEIVALKILPEQISNNPEAVKRFRLEARAARRLAHPNIVRIHDIGEEMGRKFISMEFVDGTDLKHLFRTKGAPAFEDLCRWTFEIASALDYAHRQGIVHRDIKPANIMVGADGACKIADFGIAKALDAADATMTGAVMGTPLYMSPEQIRGAQIDNRADIYSFGVMLYEFATGRPPFIEGDLAYQHLNVEPAAIDGAFDAKFASIIMKCLAKQRDDRWTTAGDIIRFLNTFADAPNK
jgi:tetratricopeptide (TPR) repeat protein